MKDFHTWMTNRQIEWRKGNVSTPAYGYQNKKPHPHVLPFAVWTENLWPDLQSGDASLTRYLGKEIQHHTGVHNLLSSWVACANMYFPFRRDPESLNLVAQFLRETVDPLIDQVTGIELEWADVGDFSPAKLLGEMDGRRGTGQTSPDVAFLVRARVDSQLEDGVVLVESKLTEKSFYRCSARANKHEDGRQANPDPSRCLDVRLIASDPATVCHQREWGRKYWNHLSPAGQVPICV